MPSPRTIAVFDSGFGGLTVLRALLPLIPGANFLYLGDTARLPYGAKSQQTIARYALSSAAFLLAQGAEMLVVACNTASALALDELKAALPIPVVGVIEPGVAAAAAHRNEPSVLPNNDRHPDPEQREGEVPLYLSSPGAPRLHLGLTKVGRHPDPEQREGEGPLHFPSPATEVTPQVLVLATAATVQSAAYTRACIAAGLSVYEKACPLLVPLVEEGWVDHPVTAEVLRIYLTEAFTEAPSVSTLVLGCTHYPLIKPLIERTLAALHHPLHIVDSAQATALAAAATLPHARSTEPTSCTFYATDSIEKFQRLGTAFLGQPLPHVHLIDLGG